MPAAARQRRAWPPRDVATWPPTARRRSVPRSAVGRPKSSAGATSVLRRHAWRTPTTASSPGREGGRSRHRRLGGRASDLPATARQRAGSGGARPRPTGRVPTDALGRGLRRTRIDEQKVEKRATTLTATFSWAFSLGRSSQAQQSALVGGGARLVKMAFESDLSREVFGF